MTKIYTRPTLHVQGKLEAMTHGSRGGDRLDATFPVNTPLKDVTTFS